MLFAWFRRRHQAAVARRCAQLRSEIAALETKADECDRIGAMTVSTTYEVQAGNLRGEAAKLRVILGHNIQHEDVL